MKKSMFVLVLIALLVSALSVSVASAQDGLPACSQEEFAGAAASFVDTFITYQELAALPDNPTASDFSELVLVLDAFDSGYWEGFSEAVWDEDVCAEVFSLGYTSGLVFDETLIVGVVSALGVHEAEAGNADLAASFIEIAAERQATLEIGLEAYGAMMTAVADGTLTLSGELPTCSAADYEATYDGLTEIAGAYLELGVMVEGATGEMLSALIPGYSALSSSYWAEFFPVVPACFEANDLAYNAGLVFDESLIVVSMLRLAELESAAGNDDLAAVLAESALERATLLEEDIEYYFADFEAA